MARRVYAVDIDGVLACFTKGCFDVAKKMGFSLPEGLDFSDDLRDRATWSVENLFGLTRADLPAVYDAISKESNFWEELPVIEEARQYAPSLCELCASSVVYFITARFQSVGRDVHDQTRWWLQSKLNIDPECCNVLVVTGGGDKSAVVELLGCAAIIEDKPSTLSALTQISGLKVFAPPTPYTTLRGVDTSGLPGFLYYCFQHRA